MPTYEYKCDKCGYVFEEFQSMNEEPLSVCPKCKGEIHRLIGAGAGLIFKGTGFYLTDYKKSNSSPATSNGDPKQDKSEKSANPKTEKPAPASKQEQPK
ncbi:MAG: zinc ribbon domain-containing protein [Bacteroidetes bacterium]|jgi:putative FmdB family regulatory protein|nr:zinc ribbon domain-containing protein [Bacteroidota bacterium]